MKAALFTRIRFRILGIVLLAIIPAVALIWFSAAERKSRMSEEIEGNTLRLARFLANNLERDLAEGDSYLTAVAALLRRDGLFDGKCSEALRTLMDEPSIYANVGLADADGHILCSGKPSAAFPGLGGLEWFHELDSAAGFSVGFDFKGALNSEASIVLALPEVSQAGALPGPRRYVFAVMDLDWLNQLAESSRLPTGSAISVTNRKGDAVARYPDPDKWVGKARQSAAAMDSLTDSEGTRETIGIDGVRRLYAYAIVAGKGGLVVNVGVLREALLEPANRALRNQLIALGIVALLAILAAWFGADVFLLQQVRALINATHQLGAGNLGARSTLSYESGELGELARAFDAMAETLEWRNAQLRESEVERGDPLAKLVDFVECVPEAFLVMDESYSVVACNKEAADLFGSDCAEIAGLPFQKLCPDIPIGLQDAQGRAPRRLRSRIAESSVHVDISMAKARIAPRTYILALIRRNLEAVPEKP